MIDTIILRLHNLKKYVSTVNILHASKKDAITRLSTDQAAGSYLASRQDIPIHAILYHNSNYLDFVNHRASISLPSSHYSVAYCINFQSDFVEFNFSIPKYRYGSNLFQFIDYFSQSAEKQWNILMDFIQRFKGNFVDAISDYDLEICRLDFCYNQFHTSREDAVRYMELQEKAFERKTRSSKGFKKYGKETLMLVTDRYSFKVYDKGTEFRKNDYKVLSEKNYKSLDLAKMQSVADRTLRYECSFRSSYFMYQWMQNYINSVKKSNRGSVYTYLYKAIKIQCAVGQHGNYNDGGLNSVVSSAAVETKKFFVASRYDNWRDYKRKFGDRWCLEFVGDHQVTFTFPVFERLYKEFWKHCKSVQIKTSSNVSCEVIKKRIAKYNLEEATKTALQKKAGKIKNTGLILHYFYISQRGSLKEYLRRTDRSRSTYQRIMVLFKRLGLDDYNPVVNLNSPSLGYQDYKYYFGSFVN